MNLTIDNISVILITLIVVILGSILFKKAAGSLNPTKINPVSGAYYFLLFLSLLGTMFFNLGTKHHTSRYMRHPLLLNTAWMTICILFIVFPLVVIAFNKLFRYKVEDSQAYLLKETVIKDDRLEFFTMVLASIVVIGSILYVFLKIGIANNPILNMLKGADSQTLARLRTMADAEFPGNQYIKNIFAIALTPFISYIAYIYMRKTKELKWLVMFIILFVFSNLMAFYNLQKAPIIIYWGSFVILSIYYGDRIKTKYLVILGLLAVGAIALMYHFISGSNYAFIFSLDGPINRVVMTTPSAYILHLEVYSYRLPFLYGASCPRPFNQILFGFSDVIRSGRQVMEAINFDGIRTGVAGVYNGLFLGEAYANFGKLGIFASMIHVPLVFAFVNFVFTKLKKNPIILALFNYWTVNLLFTLHGGYFDYWFSSIWTVVTITGLAMLIFNKIIILIFGKKNKMEKEEIIEETIEEV